MKEGPIYYCWTCEKFIRFDEFCQECGKAGDKLGWMVTTDAWE